MASYRRDVLQFTSSAALAMVQRETYSFFHPCGGTITYCSPMLENTIHQASPAQWAESNGCFGTHRLLHLLQPQDCWMTRFIQFCLWHFSNPWKTGFLLFTNKCTQNRVCLFITTKMVKTKPAAHSKKWVKAGKWKIICPRRKCITALPTVIMLPILQETRQGRK